MTKGQLFGTPSKGLRAPGAIPSLGLMVVIASAAVMMPLGAAARASDRAVLSRIADIAFLVADNFYTEPDIEAMRDGAIRGMLESLGDDYTEYIPPRDLDAFTKSMAGDYVGIGAEIRAHESGFLEIISPMDDSPALLAGLQAGDLIVAVDGRSIYQLPVNSIIALLLGEPNTRVRVTVERQEGRRAPGAEDPAVPGPLTLTPEAHTVPPQYEGEEARPFLRETVTAPGPAPGTERFEIRITRDKILAQTVRGLHRDGQRWRWLVDPESGIAYVRVSQFTPDTMEAFPRRLAELHESGIRGLVLDLRYNNGGWLDAALQMADLFLESGVVVSVRGRTTPEERYIAGENGTLPYVPMAVLVNGASASASEIVAGALADNGRAIVIGDRTFGKGLVQDVIPLPDNGGQLKITKARYYLPSGRHIQREDESTRWGVDPTPGYYVPLDDEEAFDTWTRRQREEVLRPDRDADHEQWDDPAWILEHLGDRQLTAAVNAINGQLQNGEWPEGPGSTLEAAALELDAIRALEAQRERLLRTLEANARRLDALSGVEGAAAIEGADLWADDIAVTGGEVIVRGPDGQIVATLSITGESLERWLMDAPVELSADDESVESDANAEAGSR